MNYNYLGQAAELVTVGQPAGRYWVSDTSAPGGYAFEQVASRTGVRRYYSNLEIALMAEYPELFNDPKKPEDQAFYEARQRAIQPGLTAGREVVPEPEAAEPEPYSMQDVLLPMATGAAVYSLTMAGLIDTITADVRQRMVDAAKSASTRFAAQVRQVLSKATTPTATAVEQAIQQDMMREGQRREAASKLAWPVAIGVTLFSLVGAQ